MGSGLSGGDTLQVGRVVLGEEVDEVHEMVLGEREARGLWRQGHRPLGAGLKARTAGDEEWSTSVL